MNCYSDSDNDNNSVFNVFIASHLDLYRLYTIQDTVSSISDCVEYAKFPKINCYISYSYEDFIYDKLDKLESILNSNSNLKIIFYRHKQKNLQFEHFYHILNVNTFNDNDWIMFSDDDDISINTRIDTFFDYYKNYNFNVFQSNMILIERDQNIIKPYTIENLEKNKYILRRTPDFATTIVKIKILKDFFDAYKEKFGLYTDCAFTSYIQNKKLIITEEILYIARTRMFTTEEKFLELSLTFQ